MIPICPCYTLDIAVNGSRAQSPYWGLKYCPFDWLHRNQFCFCHAKSDPDGYTLQKVQALCFLYLWPPRWVSVHLYLYSVETASTQHVPEDWFFRILKCLRAVRVPVPGSQWGTARCAVTSRGFLTGCVTPQALRVCKLCCDFWKYNTESHCGHWCASPATGAA